MRRACIALLIACSAGLAWPSNAGATLGPLGVELSSAVSPLTLTITVEGNTCEDDTLSIDEVFDDNDDPVTPVSFTPDANDPNVGTLVLPDDTVPGTIIVVARCTVGGTPLVTSGDESIAVLEVTKVVEGPAPPGTTFTVNVGCEGLLGVASFDGETGASELPLDFAVDLAYTAVGGIEYVYSDHAAVCTVSEPGTGGASSVAIDPEVIEIESPAGYFATVTNSFTAAAPIVVEPTFTG